MGRNDAKTYKQPDAKETGQFWTKIWQSREQNEKAKWINNMTKELEGFAEGPEAEKHIDLLKTTRKKYQIDKHRVMMEYMYSGSRNSPPFTTD